MIRAKISGKMIGRPKKFLDKDSLIKLIVSKYAKKENSRKSWDVQSNVV